MKMATNDQSSDDDKYGDGDQSPLKGMDGEVIMYSFLCVCYIY